MKTIAVAAFAAWGLAADADSVLESARTLPLERDTDVLVLGGGIEAVKAALAARAEGARVFLAAPRPYLGEDRAGTLRLGPPDAFDDAFPFERELWSAKDAPFTYKADAPTFKPHVDSGDLPRLRGRSPRGLCPLCARSPYEITVFFWT